MLQQEQVSAEESLFSHLKNNIQAAASLTLDRHCFSTEDRGEMFAVLQQLSRQGLPFDRKIIKEQLERRGVELPAQWWHIFDHNLPDSTSDAKTIEHYGHLLRNYAVRQEYHDFIESTLDRTLDAHMDIRQLMQQHITKIASYQDKVTLDVDPSVAAIYNRSLEVNPNPYFPSGLEAIDRNVKGLRAGHMWVISAPYKGRKTSVALNIVAAQLRAGKSVMYIALEDDDQAFLDKLVAIWGNIAHDEVTARSSGGVETERVRLARAEVAKTKLRIYDAKKQIHNWRILTSLIASDRMRFGSTDVVVVDYIQAYSVDYAVLQEIIPALIRTAAEQQIAVVVLSQMNNADLRNLRGNSPGGQDGFLATKGTGDLGAACHVGIEIGRDLQIPGELMLSVKVARNGQAQRTFAEINEASATILKNSSKGELLVKWNEQDEYP